MIAAVIVVVLVQALAGVGERLLDGVDPALLDQARSAVASVPGVQEVGDVRGRWLGNRLPAEVRMTVDRGLDAAAAHDLAEQTQIALLDALPVLDAAIVHVDPCRHRDTGDPHARPQASSAHG